MATFPLSKKDTKTVTLILTLAALTVAVFGSIRYYNEWVILKKEEESCKRLK